jgi:hypothetical protein
MLSFFLSWLMCKMWQAGPSEKPWWEDRPMGVGLHTTHFAGT